MNNNQSHSGKSFPRSQQLLSYSFNSLSFTEHVGWEAMIPYLARLLDITMNNDTLPADWKRAMVVPVHKG